MNSLSRRNLKTKFLAPKLSIFELKIPNISLFRSLTNLNAKKFPREKFEIQANDDDIALNHFFRINCKILPAKI